LNEAPLATFRASWRSNATLRWSPADGPRVAFMIADMATEIEAARALVWKSAWLKDQGRDYSLTAAQAKLFASDVSSRVTNAAIQVHGGYGCVTEYPVERYLRDAKLTEMGEGTSQVQRLVFARKILRVADRLARGSSFRNA